MNFELLDQSPGSAPIQHKILEESGLLAESPWTLLAMKAVVAEYRGKNSAAR